MARTSGKAKLSKAAPRPFSGLKGRQPIITFHSLGDLDAVGSAIALQRFLGKRAIIAPPDRPNAASRKLLDYTETPTTLFSSLKLSPSCAIIVLDSSSPHLLSHLAGVQPDIIIDHHARFGGEISAKKEINDPSASSTCEMLYFMLNPTDRISCIALLLGIVSDSAFFRHASSRTFEAAGALLERCGLSYSQIAALSSTPETLDERIEALRSCQSVSSERLGEHIVATAMAKSHEAHFADVLVHLGADIAFVGCLGEEARISARMRESLKGRVRVDRIMFEVGKVLGGSGSGHELAAGASGSPENLKAALGICVKLAEQQLLTAEHGKIKRIEW
jgi:nanoRNase/pAp phosphatase (c-di-AMP/oligoRNAs hydrolase)